jgi:NTE family protein
MIAAALPAGAVPTDIISEGLGPLFGDRWPAQPLWLCAVRLRDGARVVFGREGGPHATVGQAVAASCAIPAWFQPVEIEGERYVDGGAHSPTNLDLVAGLGLDLIVVSSPMSSAGRGLRIAPDAVARQLFRNYLDREAMRVRRRGTPVIAFQPTAADQAVMGGNPMDASKRGPVVSRVRESTLHRLERAEVRDRLRLRDHRA